MKRLTVNKKRIVLIVAIISLVTITAVTIVCGIRYNEISAIRKGQFEFSLWDKFPNHRYHMIEDMEHQIDIWTLSRDEIVEKLGTNDMKTYVGESDSIYIGYVIKRVYGVVPWSTMIIEYYNIKLTNDGYVEDIGIFSGT